MLHQAGICLLTVFLGFFTWNDVVWPALMADSAVKNRGRAAETAEACRGIVGA